VGHDLVRAAPRVFRLSRILGKATAEGPDGAVSVPDGVDLRAMVAREAAEMQPQQRALVRIRQGSCWELRRASASVTPDTDGWDLVELGFSDTGRLADRIAGYGADAIVLSPDDARLAVVERLTHLATAGGPA
jgi:predicted DNA-binding transcriptional regulator YafY